jgi:hypothetical protein
MKGPAKIFVLAFFWEQPKSKDIEIRKMACDGNNLFIIF